MMRAIGSALAVFFVPGAKLPTIAQEEYLRRHKDEIKLPYFLTRARASRLIAEHMERGRRVVGKPDARPPVVEAIREEMEKTKAENRELLRRVSELERVAREQGRDKGQER